MSLVQCNFLLGRAYSGPGPMQPLATERGREYSAPGPIQPLATERERTKLSSCSCWELKEPNRVDPNGIVHIHICIFFAIK